MFDCANRELPPLLLPPASKLPLLHLPLTPTCLLHLLLLTILSFPLHCLQLKDDSFDVLFVSPLQRARQTADIVAAGRGELPSRTLPALREIDLYSFQVRVTAVTVCCWEGGGTGPLGCYSQ